MTGGRKPRYEYYELFDAGNVDEHGNVLGLDHPRTQYGKVGTGHAALNPQSPAC